MITSMTGYGEGAAQGHSWIVSVKIKTLNHKYLDLQVRGLEGYEALELRAMELLRKSFRRGRIEAAIQLQREGWPALTFDVATARQHYEALRHLAQELGLDEHISLDHLLRLSGALQPLLPDPEGLWPVLEEAFQKAIDAAWEMRCREGQALAAELTQHLRALEQALAQVEAHATQLKWLYRERLQQRIRALEPDIQLNAERVEQEVALWAERADITEEIARLRIHLGAAEEALKGPEPAGRPLDFLAQEMYREVNTMAAKARDGELAQRLIEMKNHIECLREQIRNIE